MLIEAFDIAGTIFVSLGLLWLAKLTGEYFDLVFRD